MNKFKINVPIKYVPFKLSKKDTNIVKNELNKSRRAYKKKKYYTRKRYHLLNQKKVNILVMQKKYMD